MTKAAKQTASGKHHANHSKSKEDKMAREKARKAKRQLAVDAKAKALAEAKENGMTWDDTIVGQRFVDDYDAAYKAATAGGPAIPETEVTGDAGLAEATVVLPGLPQSGSADLMDATKRAPIPVQKSMIAEAVEAAKAEAAMTEKPSKSAEESAAVFKSSPAEKVDGLKVFAEFVAAVLKAAIEADNAKKTDDPVEATSTAEPREDVPGSEAKELAPVDESGKTAPQLSKNQLKKIARREAKRALQEAKRTNVEATDITPSIEATASATESATVANENEPTVSGSEIPVTKSQPETVASTGTTEQSVTVDESSGLEPEGKKKPWHKRTAYDTMKAGVLALPPPEPKRPTQEEINAAETETGSQVTAETDNASAQDTANTETPPVEAVRAEVRQVAGDATAGSDDLRTSDSVPELINTTEAVTVEASSKVDTGAASTKPTLKLVPNASAQSFYGAAYTAERAKLLDGALHSLNMAIKYEAEGKKLKDSAFALALKRENEAFAIVEAMKKAA
jgi:hypothetical protein